MRTRSILGVSLLTVVLSGWTTTARAQELSLEGSFSGINIVDQSHRALMNEGGSAGLGFTAGLELEQVRGLRFLVSYGADGTIGSRFDRQVDYSWGRNRVMAGADYGVDFFGGAVRPLVRALGGYSVQSLTLTADGESYSGLAHGAGALVAGGLELSLGRRSGLGAGFWSRVSLGANLFGGYLWQSPGRFEQMESSHRPDEEDPWIRASYDAGEMGASGWYLSLGAMVRYRFGS